MTTLCTICLSFHLEALVRIENQERGSEISSVLLGTTAQLLYCAMPASK